MKSLIHKLNGAVNEVQAQEIISHFLKQKTRKRVEKVLQVNPLDETESAELEIIFRTKHQTYIAEVEGATITRLLEV